MEGERGYTQGEVMETGSRLASRRHLEGVGDAAGELVIPTQVPQRHHDHHTDLQGAGEGKGVGRKRISECAQ